MARPATRTPEVYEMIAERLRRGEYSRGPLPSTRKLGTELGVSKFTILRALRLAEKKGLLRSKGRNRFALSPSGSKKKAARFACVVPAIDLASSFNWFLSIDNVALQRGGSATLIDYRSVSSTTSFFSIPLSIPLPRSSAASWHKIGTAWCPFTRTSPRWGFGASTICPWEQWTCWSFTWPLWGIGKSTSSGVCPSPGASNS
ncbi:MAG: GntR family transcriptional regulator [Verrucomicrobia bacterium]|nr:GntR family transcriptional regulator [Verrucomicrobiota bacterium]